MTKESTTTSIATKPERDSNIELLRIVVILFVIIQHFNGATIGGGFAYTDSGSLNELFILFFHGICRCAVNVFLLISGYFMCKSSKPSLLKPVKFITQMLLISEIIYLVRSAVGDIEFTWIGILTALIPIPIYWFIILYATLCVISPYINILLNNLDIKALQRLVIICILLFSVYPTIIDVANMLSNATHYGLSTIGFLGTQSGFTIVNFVLVYIIGAYLRIAEIKPKRVFSLLVFLGTAIITFIFTITEQNLNHTTDRIAWSYSNPIIIVMAVSFFLLFSSFNIKSNKLINTLSMGVFPTYLIHRYLLVAFTKAESHMNINLFFMCIYVLTFAILIFLFCWLYGMIYDLATRPLWRKLNK